MIRAGESFVIPGSTGETDHLMIVITDWDERGDSVTVNITDYENIFDPVIDIPAGVLLTPAFTTTKRSTINYAQARRVPALLMDKVVHSQSVQQKGLCDPNWLARIREQLFASSDTPDPVLNYCEAFDWGE
jgi:hypothetical protein